MKKIEIALLIIILILVSILIYYNPLIIWLKRHISQRKFKPNKILAILNKLYDTFRVIRRFSLVYALKNRFYKFYLLVAIAIVVTKISIYFHPQIEDSIPILLDKSLDFLIVSSAWEIICIITKTIDDKINDRK